MSRLPVFAAKGNADERDKEYYSGYQPRQISLEEDDTHILKMSLFARGVKFLSSTIDSYLYIQIRAISAQILHHLAKRRHRIIHIHIAVQVTEHLFFFKLVSIIPWDMIHSYICCCQQCSYHEAQRAYNCYDFNLQFRGSFLQSLMYHCFMISTRAGNYLCHGSEANKPKNVLYIKHKIALQLN